MGTGSSSTGRMPKYRELAGKMAEQMAMRFGHDPKCHRLADRQ